MAKSETRTPSRSGGFGNDPKPKESKPPNSDLFTFCKIPVPLKELYVSNGEVVACLDANGEPWVLSYGKETGKSYWNKMTLGGRRRKTKEEQDSSDEDQLKLDSRGFKDDDIPY